ncbi:MAG: CBS domain-containing protein [Deltaproteobacteria bacterium]|nr:CBS domain-containing protein [Deltaproteobacteria bacterium]
MSEPQTLSRTTPLAQVMSTRPVTIELDAQPHLADTLMNHHAIHHLPVVKGGVLQGLISQRDLFRHMMSFFFVENNQEQHDFLDSFLDIPSIMTPDPLTLGPDDTLGAALDLMIEHKIGCVPVVNGNNQLVGILTESDLLRLMTLALA